MRRQIPTVDNQTMFCLLSKMGNIGIENAFEGLLLLFFYFNLRGFFDGGSYKCSWKLQISMNEIISFSVFRYAAATGKCSNERKDHRVFMSRAYMCVLLPREILYCTQLHISPRTSFLRGLIFVFYNIKSPGASISPQALHARKKLFKW